jgi:hypothetical protein
MEKNQLVKQMINLQKTTFDSYFSMIIKLQDQAEKLVRAFTDQTPCMSDESKKALENWNAAYKKQRDDFKKAVDQGYSRMESFFDCNAMEMFQEQTEKMFSNFLQQSSWMPKDFKKATEELSAMYKNGHEEFKKYIDDNIRRVGNLHSTAEKQQTKAKQKK